MHRAWMLVCVLVVGGCGGGSHPPVHPVTGIVTYKEKPVAGAEVVFLPLAESAAQAPSATTDAEGRYRLKTMFSAETEVTGAPAGKYRVTISHIEAPPPGFDPYKSPTGNAAKHLLPEKYSASATSPFQVTVEAKSNEIPFNLTD